LKSLGDLTLPVAKYGTMFPLIVVQEQLESRMARAAIELLILCSEL
jgi:hypothetical protein